MSTMQDKPQKYVEMEALPIAGQRLLYDVPLSRLNTWKIGGPADVVFSPETIEELQAMLCWVQKQQIPWITIGDGSNLLFADAGFRGVVIHLGENISRVTIAGTRIHVEAGAWVPRLAFLTGRAGLSGLEHTIGIPGRIGGLVYMNGGSQRRNIGENIVRVEALSPHGVARAFMHDECGFSYRTSRFQQEHWIITGVELELQGGDARRIREVMLNILRSRRKKFPRKLPNCGSVFKSDPKMYEQDGPPGKLIEECGLKGSSCGFAEVSPLHANFIVNTGAARAEDVLNLVERVIGAVEARYGYRLETEARYVCPDGRTMGISEYLSIRESE